MPYRILNLPEAAEYLHLTEKDLRELVLHREVPCERQGARVTFRKKDLDAWASQRIMGLTEGRLAKYHQSGHARIRGHHGGVNTLVGDLLRPEFIAPAVLSRTRSGLIRDLAALAESTGLVTDSAEFVAMLREREEMCSTALPGGFALLHPRHHEPYMFAESFLVLGRVPHALPFGAPDGQNTDLFFLIGCQDDRIHLHVLARLCMMCTRTILLQELRAGADRDEMHAALCRAEGQILALNQS